MKKCLILLSFIMIFTMAGCTSASNKLPDRDPDAIGLIYEIDAESQRILVVSDIENVDITYDEWFEAGKYAVFFKVTEDTIINDNGTVSDFSSLKEGQKVEIWHTGVLAESYPMQGEAVYVNIVN
ncbi:DUF3221 domain-containing protein [Sedimentibacter sp.]|uniref:DUF3221 domain-containing protein n=1 Tax=Sedimentibacter sp. TaxID=1960295 RepID=UPI0028A5B1BF|nr:DUF3221 domain-containing protein [Sedimentibacter sp.]